MNQKISETLGLMTISEAKHGEVILPEENVGAGVSDADAEADKKYARENMKEIIEHGTSALGDIIDIARATEEPRAFEVISNLMKTLVDANKALVSLSNTGKKPQKSDVPSSPQSGDGNNVTNNNLFVGSTQDLMEFINKRDGK